MTPTTRHPGYAISQCIRKRIEEDFGWVEFSAGLRQTKFRRLGLYLNAPGWKDRAIVHGLRRLHVAAVRL